LVHQIDDHIDYLMVRIDPRQGDAGQGEAASQAYLKTTR